MVARYYDEPILAPYAREVKGYKPGGDSWRGIDPEDRVIMMYPGMMILGHTAEFVGGTKDPETDECFTAEMKARSSAGRLGFEVCRCAGWGDVGYVNRWTMEIVCTSMAPIILVCGTRLAQMKFYQVEPVEDAEMYGADTTRDRYQSGVDIEAIKEAWRPQQMVPRLSKR
jgi:dCTP deaminase